MASIIALKKKNPVFLCARGGMRSASVSSLAASFGIDCFRIINGYKGYRNWVVSNLETITETLPPLVILQGLTGAGKTRVIKLIDNSIDLEGMAGHRSSLFGAIGLEPVSQKRFESRLLHSLIRLKDSQWILVEGESRKIGNLHIPDRFFSLMRASRAVYLDTPIEKRIEIILEEYAGAATLDEVAPIIEDLKGRIGGEAARNLLDLFSSGDLTGFARALLQKYYDPLYSHTIKNLDYLFKVEYTHDREVADKISHELSCVFQPGK
jgi:tRNA 2-selenouridine synthase